MFETAASDVCGPFTFGTAAFTGDAGVPGTDEITPHSKVTNWSFKLTASVLATTHRQSSHHGHPKNFGP